MIIHWTVCYDHRPARFEQPEKDKLVASWNGKEVAIDFSDPEIVEYELTGDLLVFVHRAWREDGELNLIMPSLGPLDEPRTIDHGEDKVLSWRK